MKKLSLLVGALGSTIGSTAAWYILSNKKLRTELGKAKGPEETIKILKKYIGGDAEKIGKAVHEFFSSEEMQEKIEDAKVFAGDTFAKMKTGFGGLLERGKKMKDEAMESEKMDDAMAFAEDKLSKVKTGFGGLLSRGKKMKEAAMEKWKKAA